MVRADPHDLRGLGLCHGLPGQDHPGESLRTFPRKRPPAGALRAAARFVRPKYPFIYFACDERNRLTGGAATYTLVAARN